MDEPVFCSNLSIEEIEENFESTDYFEELKQSLIEAIELEKGISDLENGRVHDGKAVMEEMRLKYLK